MGKSDSSLTPTFQIKRTSIALHSHAQSSHELQGWMLNEIIGNRWCCTCPDAAPPPVPLYKALCCLSGPVQRFLHYTHHCSIWQLLVLCLIFLAGLPRYSRYKYSKFRTDEDCPCFPCVIGTPSPRLFHLWSISGLQPSVLLYTEACTCYNML